ncbi:MAG: hypothetical protein DI582_06940 [Azospirillum brasilense]|nr:MAG: hypothetical protein DI582_06940 [Azospirillum brasilense]
MTEALPPTTPTPAPRSGNPAAMLIVAATIVLLGAIGGVAYILNERLTRLANAEPQAPRVVTDALEALKDSMDTQAAAHARQVSVLQQELAAIRDQQPHTTPEDMEATLAPVQEKLDAIAQKLEQPAPVVAPAPAPEAPVAEAPSESTSPAEGITAEAAAAMEKGEPLPVTGTNTLRDYLALRRAVESGAPFEAELEALEPQVGALDAQDQEILYTYADTGLANLPAPRAEDIEEQNPGWMQRINTRLAGLVTIRRSDAAKAAPGSAPAELDVTRDDVLAVLDKLEAHVMKATE